MTMANNPRPLTTKTIALVNKLSAEMGETPERIKAEQELMQRMTKEEAQQ
jgi:hypothetical protein